MTNWEIARNFLYASKLMALDSKGKLAKLYEKSAYSIAALDYSINSENDVLFLPDNVREDLKELLYTGRIGSVEDIKMHLPKGVMLLMKLPNITPDNIWRVYNSLNISSISDLHRALDNNKFKELSGFGARFSEQLRKSLLSYNKDYYELTLFEAYSYASSVKRLLLSKGLHMVEIAGDLRRGKEKVGKLSFVLSGDAERIFRLLRENISHKKIEIENNSSIILKDKENIKLEFRIVPREFFFSALIYYTGSKLHNEELKRRAVVKGYRISRQGYILIKGDGEKQIYRKLGLQYIPPEIREGEEEIELAEKNALPHLINYSDIQGDLHIHSNFSDGTNFISDIKEEALFHGYRYIAITDHSYSLRIANGLSKNRLLSEMDIIDKLNREGEITIFKGSEIEIGKNGDLDFDNEVLEKLDVRIAAMHTGFENSTLVNTARLTKALSNRFVNILAHPTGRVISVREGFRFDVKKVFNLAIKNNVALEVNVFPKRMDLSAALIKQARRAGVKYFSINTDSHNVGHLNFMRYGVKILRRAYLTKDNVINTFNLEDLERFLWTKKR